MPTRIVAISHATGAGGNTIGRMIAERLGFRYIDEEIISLAAHPRACRCPDERLTRICYAGGQ